MSKYFLCYACCIPVRGHTRSIVCDLQRGTFVFIPNVLVDILEMSRERSVQEIHAHYDHAHDEQIDAYFEFLIEKNLGFYTETPQRFPPMSLDWRNPKILTNCVLDFDAGSEHDLRAINEQLSGLGCEALEMRFFYPVELEALSRHLECFRDSTLRSISILVGYHASLQPQALEELLLEHKRVKHITLHSSPERDEAIQVDLQSRLVYTPEKVDSEACCGNVSSRDFSAGIGAFTESLRFNNCLNKKVGIDKRGAIKNCPSMRESFGDIRSTPLSAVVEREEFRKPWGVTKDQVLVCQDCEFRYICHDCRAYLKDPEQPLSKPAKCRYNPYAGRWEE
jgi:SPASM domain peptide maturase of grasp-with-spasm system